MENGFCGLAPRILFQIIKRKINDLSFDTWSYQKFYVNSLLVLRNFTTARKSGNILLTYLKAFFFVRHSSEYENVG